MDYCMLDEWAMKALHTTITYHNCRHGRLVKTYQINNKHDLTDQVPHNIISKHKSDQITQKSQSISWQNNSKNVKS